MRLGCSDRLDEGKLLRVMTGQVRMTAEEFRKYVAGTDEKKGETSRGTGRHQAEPAKPVQSEAYKSLRNKVIAAVLLLAIGYGIGSSANPALESRIERLESVIEQLDQ